jgi:predicted transposase YbfD/YdcC
MTKKPLGALTASFQSRPDPGVDRTKHHLLLDIVTIAVCAVVCGADGWTEVEAFGKIKKKGIIIERQADYLLALKKNQKRLAEDVLTLYEWAHSIGITDLQHDHLGTASKGHGRVEIRECWMISAPPVLGQSPARTGVERPVQCRAPGLDI